MSTDATPTSDPPTPPPSSGRPPPTPIVWETELSTRDQAPDQVRTTALDAALVETRSDRDG